MFSIGVAGHVDHGKTSLVRALTGVETDRLPEEKRRGISIEPGFARLDLQTASGLRSVSLVDLPGHERFVRRMVCGAQGLSALLLVIGADSGVMPQTREHLAIAALLGLQRGIVVLSRCDLVEPEWLPLVQEEVRVALSESPLRDAPLVCTSLRDPVGLDALRAALATLVDSLAHDSQLTEGSFRLAVDRMLLVPGHGAVATGNAQQGQLRPGDEVEVVPAGGRFRVRGLAQHGQSTTEPDLPGRLAVQLAAAELADVPAGSWLVQPGTVRCVDRLDAVLHLLPHAPSLDARATAQLLLGTADAEVRVVQLSGEPQLAGTSALVQLQLATPLAVPPRSRFLLRGFSRDPSHGWTIGGGEALLLDPPRHTLADSAVLAELTQLHEGTDTARLLALVGLHGVRGLPRAEIARQLGWGEGRTERALRTLLGGGHLRWGGERLLVPSAVQWLEERAHAVLARFHERQPAATGLQAAALAAQTADWLDAAALVAVLGGLVRRGKLRQYEGDVLSLADFVPQRLASEADCALVLGKLQAAGLAAPTPAVLAVELGWPASQVEVALAALGRAGSVQRIAEDYHASAEAVENALVVVRQAFANQPTLETAVLKDVLGLTRKHLIPFLEYLDASKITLRTASGERVLRQRAR